MGDSLNMSSSAEVRLRTSFTAQFLKGAALFARRAREIEDAAGPDADEETKSEHTAYVVAAIMQSVAALEAEISEVILYGPAHHQGSSVENNAARDFLAPLSEELDRQKTLRRYELVLHCLGKPPLVRGAPPYQSADLLVSLRNQLVHYKSRWGQEMDGKKFFNRLKDLRFEKPPFVRDSANFFPYHILSSSCASWSAVTATKFIDTFYGSVGVISSLDPHKKGLSEVPEIRLRK